MFIIDPIKKEDASGELKLLYRMIERSLGFVPPHFELFATIDIEAMKEFVQYNQKMLSHQTIHPNLLPYLRLYIAQKECRNYCTNFNTQLLLKQGAPKELLENMHQNIDNIPLDTEQVSLFNTVIKALYNTEEFNENDLNELSKEGFENRDFFDLLSYASNFISKSKMIEVYLK